MKKQQLMETFADILMLIILVYAAFVWLISPNHQLHPYRGKYWQAPGSCGYWLPYSVKTAMTIGMGKCDEYFNGL